ncbi:hypothetical protein [Niabella aurantiaca]|uniref:hypothetical protein n=1 Tax=Niabella aurantiaca TaxID=379900 RepID=UPI00036AD9EA|nr:hypothetical protein [Niabella aurantiaca]
MRKIFICLFTTILFTTIVAMTSCKKQYYFDSGLSTPTFDGSMLEYLESNPFLFDTLVSVIRMAGLENYFKDSAFTFFVPADSSIRSSLQYFNLQLKLEGKDTIRKISDVKPEFWRSTLMMYMYRSVRGLEDYPQLDVNNKQAFPGEFVRSMSGKIMNIGTIFTDARGIKYKGFRFLNLSFVPNEAAPYNSWFLGPVATCNIKPRNGIAHVLVYPVHFFGFDVNQAWLQARYYGFD